MRVDITQPAERSICPRCRVVTLGPGLCERCGKTWLRFGSLLLAVGVMSYLGFILWLVWAMGGDT